MFKFSNKKNWSVADVLTDWAMVLLVLWCLSLIVTVFCSEAVATGLGLLIAFAAVVSFAITVILIAGKLYEEHNKYGW